MGVHKATIGRERRRNRGARGYRSRLAQRLARRRRRGVRLSLEWISRSVFGTRPRALPASAQEALRRPFAAGPAQGDGLDRGAPRRRGRQGGIGDGEVDTLIGEGHRQARVTLNERRSMSTLIAHVKRRRAEAVVRRLFPFKHCVWTITADHGKEFAAHHRIARRLKADSHPCASWERGQNGNTNGRIRPYVPKGMDFTTLTEQQRERVMGKLNHQPRKTLDVKIFMKYSSRIPIRIIY